jgi:ribosome-associated translation inhibitor RaiA
MDIPLQIEFRNMDRSAAIETAIEERCKKLERFAGDVMRCKVTVEAPHRHHAKGNLYHVSIDLHVPGAEIVVNRDPSRNHAHEDPYVAVRDAVSAAARQLQDYVRVRRGKIKTHEALPHGQIVEVHPEEDYGRIADSTGRLIYFHRNSLLDASLEDVSVGDEVRFDEEQGDQGPQASSVRLIGKHHIVP